jgi:hypothetical protein
MNTLPVSYCKILSVMHVLRLGSLVKKKLFFSLWLIVLVFEDQFLIKETNIIIKIYTNK